MHVRVKCDAGARADQTPQRFELDGRIVEVEEVLDQWQGEDYRYFKLRGEDRNLYILRLNEAAGEWDLTLYETPRGAEIFEQPPAQLPGSKRPSKPH
ncbi:MAG: hypothetical protein OEM91_02630 [Hyphomicrobiales bacterium]|nr:hypothetical protein [Hyphomicrobiales bacterium]